MQPPEFQGPLPLSVAPAADELNTVPKGNGVFLFHDDATRPLMLGVAANLRVAITSKLLVDADDPLDKKRVKLAGVARSVSWVETVNEFERYLIYWLWAQKLYPKTYRKLLPFSECWFISIDPESTYPRFIASLGRTKSSDFAFGPFIRRKDAEYLIRLLEDGFDLCRYYDVLLQTPKGQACAYFDMGRCPAPCDGTVEMSVYHASINHALRFMKQMPNALAPVQARMQSAASETNFELAGVYKRVANELDEIFRKPAFRYAHSVNHAAWIVITLQSMRQRRSDKSSLRAYGFCRGNVQQLTGGKAVDIACLIDQWISELTELQNTVEMRPEALTVSTALLARFLFKPDQRMVAILTDEELRDQTRVAKKLETHLFTSACPRRSSRAD